MYSYINIIYQFDCCNFSKPDYIIKSTEAYIINKTIKLQYNDNVGVKMSVGLETILITYTSINRINN